MKPTIDELRGAFRYAQKRCERCGALFEQRGYRKYCDDCQSIVKNEQTRESRERKKNPPVGETVEATCRECGITFSYVYRGGLRRQYCNVCSANRRIEDIEKIPRKKKKPRVSQIEAINDAARKAGMSYGQYQAMKAMGRV